MVDEASNGQITAEMRGTAALTDVLAGGTLCRFCSTPLHLSVVDLGLSPLCESLIAPDELERPERFFPLHVRVCDACWLAQIPQVVPPEEIFADYAYFSAYSDSWVEHARRYVETIAERLSLGADTLVVELASNDGYLLQHFVARGIPVLGIDPAANVAEAALARGVPTLVDFFGLELAERLASEGKRAQLVIGNNVLAQVPDLNDFVAGVAALLEPEGTATFEFPHLEHLLDRLEYDTIYHEHFSYFSLYTICKIFEAHRLRVFDVDELATHGGSLRIYVCHRGAARAVLPAVGEIVSREEVKGLRSPSGYERFERRVCESRWELLELLISLRRQQKHVVGYGAPGKGNTLLNYCGIRTDLLEYTVDRNEFKHGKYTPGTHIPIYAPAKIGETKPDVIVVLPWNLVREISEQLAYTAEWGATLVVPVPHAQMFAPGALPGP